MSIKRNGVILTGLLFATGLPIAQADRLEDVKKSGEIVCGVNQGLPGFSAVDDEGNWKGIDADYCRALAAAVYGDSSKIKFRPLSSKERFTALQSGEVDVLARNTTWTQSRDTALGLNFIGVNFYDGQGFIVKQSLGVDSVKQLDGAVICAGSGTTTELNVADYFRTENLKYEIVTFEKVEEVIAAYEAGRCDSMTADRTALYANRTKMSKPAENIVLPEVISKEPLGPAVIQGDDGWFNVARWTLFCMINAEELGVSSENVAAMSKTENPSIKRLLGQEGKSGENLNLSADWCANIIEQVGNYGESFDRNLGTAPLNIDRGINALWNAGGILYAPPVR
ncbi:MAG: amino acid ABC transporter substrate-binding protein [Gammaproteobacteria bacterium]|nr:amino acid ABC transporter substrate-binding protein [Gammaproteobacteria bacterium]